MTPYTLLIECRACGTKNRVPASRLSDSGRCGSCKAALPPRSEPIEVDDPASFDAIIQSAKVPVLVDFWADWCGPCKMVAPAVHQVAQDRAGKALVLKVDTERYPELAARYRVQSIPNFVVFRDGKVVNQQAGAAPAATIRRWLDV